MDTVTRGSEDPGMAVKMAPPGFRGIRELAGGGVLTASGRDDLEAICDFVDARHDCSDFRALVLIKTLLAWGDRLPEATRERISTTLMRHKYWMDEPGRDGMCLWSENHQVVTGVTQYLAGQHWPDEVFANSGRRGVEQRERAAERLRLWLDHRFRFGFSEWLSPIYYEEDAAALAVLVDEADDPELVTAASSVLDLLMLDLALHSFPTGPRFLPSSGRCYDLAKVDPKQAPVQSLVEAIAGTDADWDETQLGALLRLSSYRIPPVITAIAQETKENTVRATFGLDAGEVVDAVGPGITRAGLFFWGMEAITTPESVELTSEMLHHYDLVENPFLKDFTPFAELRGRGVLPQMMHIVNPATQGVALHRADVVTTRSSSWLVSAAQAHNPRRFGDQQHIWQVLLPGDVSVFSTHPSEPFFADRTRDFSPSEWIGNGRLPLVAADANAVLVLHDLTGRSGYLESPRRLLSHVYWPADLFDQEERGDRWLAGRVDDSYVGVLALRDLEDGMPGEVKQYGRYTAWVAICSDAAEAGSFEWFVAGLRRSAMRLVRERGRRVLEVQTDPMWEPARERWQWRLGPERDFMIDGERIDLDHPRLDSVYGRVERDSKVFHVEHGGHGLTLDWAAGAREVR